MPIARPSQDELQRRIYNRIREETSITAELESSVIGVIVKIIAAELSPIWDTVEDLYRQSNISTATGSGLDLLGSLVGVARKQSRPATTLGFTRSVRFTNNGSALASIPSGTRVWKESDPQVAFFTTEGLVLSPGDSGFAHVTAANVGEIYNVPSRALTSHNAANVNVAVTNVLPIENGSLLESDDSYRERIIQEFRRRNGASSDNIISLLRAVPGVRDVWLLEMERGAGTFDAVIIPYEAGMGAEVVAEAQRLLNTSVAAGISARARLPVYRQLDVNVSIRFSPDVGDRRESIRQRVRGAISSLVDNLPVEDGTGNGTLFVGRIRSTVLVMDSAILDATVDLGFDGSPIASDGELPVSKGERIILRALTVS